MRRLQDVLHGFRAPCLEQAPTPEKAEPDLASTKDDPLWGPAED
jgi:hypothetical protein